MSNSGGKMDSRDRRGAAAAVGCVSQGLRWQRTHRLPRRKLTEKMDASAKSIADARKKVYVDRIEQIRQILTPDQIQAITK
jgi:hypothetical protein